MSAVVQIGFDGKPVMAGLSGLETRLAGFANKTSSLLGGTLGGAIGGLSFAGATAGAKVLLDQYGRLADIANRFEAPIEDMQRLGLAAAMSGSDMETVANSLTVLNKALDSPENKKAAAAFERLGVNLDLLKTATPFEQFQILSEAFQEAQKTGSGFADIMAVLGRSGSELIPLLRSSREEMEALSKAPVLSDEQVARMEEAGDKLELIGYHLKVTLAGALSESLPFFNDWGTQVMSVIDGLNGAFEGVAKLIAEPKSAGEWLPGEAVKALVPGARLAELFGLGDVGDAVNKSVSAAMGAGESDGAGSSERDRIVTERLEKLKKAGEEERKRAEEIAAIAKATPVSFDVGTASVEAGAEKVGEGGGRLLDSLVGKVGSLKGVLEPVGGFMSDLAGRLNDWAEKSGEEMARRQEGLDALAREAELLAAKAGGQEALVKQLEREESIRSRMLQIVEATGMEEGKALDVAKKLQDLVDQGEKREMEAEQKKDPSGRVQGYSWDEMGGRDQARGRAAARRAEGDEKRAGAYKRGFEGLDGFYADQKDPDFARAKTPVLDAFFSRRGTGESGISMGRAATAAAGARSDQSAGLLSEIKRVLDSANDHLSRLSAA